MAEVGDYSLGECSSTYFNSSALVNTNYFCSVNEGQNCNEELHQVIAQLSPERPFLSFDLRLSTDDISLLNQLHIHTKQEYSNFGELQNLSSDLKFFIESLAPENDKISNPIAELIAKLVDDVVLGNQQGESAWVLVRASIANSEFDLPDWHTDPCIAQAFDNSYDDIRNCKKNEHNVIFSLKGPSTLFSLLPAEKREEFNFKADIMNYFGNETHVPLILIDSTDNNVDSELLKRQELAKIVNTSDIFSVDFGQGYVFLASNTYGAVHTAPPIHEERLFIAVFPGGKEEVRKLEEKLKLVNSKIEAY